MSKKTVENNNNKIKKSNKRLKALIWVFSGLALCGMLAAGHFIYKSCSGKTDPTVSTYSVTIHQPEDEKVAAEWVIEASTDNENFKTGTFKAKSSDTIYVRARKIASDGSYRDAPSNVYKICVVYGETKQEFSFEKDGDMYKGYFPMMPRDIDVYITAHYDISQYIYAQIGNDPWVVESSYTDISQPIKLYKFDTIFEKEPVVQEYPRSGENAFNMDVHIGNKVKTIQYSFLSSCKEFNSRIIFDENSTCETIGEGFLDYCEKFNTEIVLPDSVKSIGDAFLYGCFKFNQPLNTNKVENLFISESQYGFMFECTSFNSELKIPNVKRIPSRFLWGCSAFDQTLEIPSCTTQILSEFMNGCDNFCSNLDTRLIVNCSADAFFSAGDNRTLTVLSKDTPAFKNGINVDGSLATQMPVLFPDHTTEEFAEFGYRHWRI